MVSWLKSHGGRYLKISAMAAGTSKFLWNSFERHLFYETSSLIMPKGLVKTLGIFMARKFFFM